MDLLDRPDMKTAEQRRAARADLNAVIDRRLSTNTQEHWIERLNAAGVPCGKVLSVAEVFEDPQVKAQEMVIEVDQGSLRTKIIRNYLHNNDRMAPNTPGAYDDYGAVGVVVGGIMRSTGGSSAGLGRMLTRSK